MRATEFPSALNAADLAPLLVYGHGAVASAALFSAHTSVACVAADEWDDLVALLADRPFIGILAHSPAERPGEAGRAIRLFRESYGDTETALYSAWDYNVRRAALRAIEYGADGIIMPGIDVNELLQCVIAYLHRVAKGLPRLASPEEHEALLRPLTPKSPFWRLQDRVVSPYF